MVDSVMLNAALALAGEGFQVFPCVYRTKVPPQGSRGLHDATANAATIRRWFGGWHQRNLAVRTGAVSRCWVLDVDDAEALGTIEALHGRLPETRVSRSSRGHHYWWRLGSTPVPSSVGRIAPHVDVRGEGGYVLAPPSVHDTGIVYGWANDASLVEAPVWLVELAIRRPALAVADQALAHQQRPRERVGAYGRAALESEIALLSRTGNGARNQQLNRSSFRLHQLVAVGALNGGEVVQRLIEACHANGLAIDAASGGMPQVMRTIWSGARAGLQHPRSPKGRDAR